MIISIFMQDLPLYKEYCDIARKRKNRYNKFDDDLKIQLQPLIINRRISNSMNKIIDLLGSTIWYPELENRDYIIFDELSNDCIRKILAQTFILKFTSEDTHLDICGESINGVTFKAIYFIPEKIRKLDFFSDNPIKEELPPLPINGTIIDLFPRMVLMKVRLPRGFFHY
jgi:hypothetical protein